MKRIAITTEDGSQTLFVPEIDEHYHSTKGAYTESQHIYINKGLKANSNENIKILEVGFGTGLNALLTLNFLEEHQKNIEYTTIEKYPLTLETVEQLSYETYNVTDVEKMKNLHLAPWNKEVEITPKFKLIKIDKDFIEWLNSSEHRNQYDVIFFDAFSPDKQPELWEDEVFKKLYEKTNNNGILVTYCAKGRIRRSLQQAQFKVERLQGPPNGKREILRATKI